MSSFLGFNCISSSRCDDYQSGGAQSGQTPILSGYATSPARPGPLIIHSNVRFSHGPFRRNFGFWLGQIPGQKGLGVRSFTGPGGPALAGGQVRLSAKICSRGKFRLGDLARKSPMRTKWVFGLGLRHWIGPSCCPGSILPRNLPFRQAPQAPKKSDFLDFLMLGHSPGPNWAENTRYVRFRAPKHPNPRASTGQDSETF